MPEIWPKWGKFWPLRSLWRNLHIFLDILDFREENKTKMLIGKTVLKIGSQVGEQRYICPQNYL